MKKAILVITVIVFVVAAFAFVKVGMPLIRLSRGQQDVLNFNNMREMAASSPYIVRAETLSATVTRKEFGNAPDDIQVLTSTVYTIRILEIFRGELEVGDEIEMDQWWGGRLWRRNGLSIREGDDLVLFLTPRTDFPATIFGVYRLSRSVPSDVEIDTSIKLRPVRYRRLPGNGVRVTVQDLWDLREN